MERGRAPAIGKYCCVADGTGAPVCADSSAPSSPLCVDGYSARSRTVARYQTGVSQLDFLFRARRSVPWVFPFGGARVAQAFGGTGQERQSALHHRNAQGLVHQSADVCALPHIRRVRLADESQLPLVLNHVRRLYLCRRSRCFDVAPCSGDHRVASSRLPEGHRHRGALPHHGEMDAGLLRFLGLHRLRSVHAHLVREPPGGNAIFHHSKYPILVGTEYAPGDWPVLHSVPHFANALHQEASTPALHRGRMDCLHADARHLLNCSAFVTRHRLSSQYLGFAFAHRHWRDARFRLSATGAQDFTVSRARSAPDRISANRQLKWPTPNLSARLHIRALHYPRGWG